MEFTLKTTIKATAKQIYKAWLSTQGHTKMTGGVAFISDKVGDSFTAWGDHIKGKNLVLEPYHKIVQSWRGSDFKNTDEDSQIEIILNEIEAETELTLNHTNTPEDKDSEHYVEGWKRHYFEPMKAYFEFKK
ncbi:hypothetical protein D7030_14850 [Flavobacteriaceae bacterium AU392]|nr:hypothetical protein D1817_03640 [Flavobacteriaceae bacterium]RKM81575.1 hypothetical protein D7030_14850 [Flavobacteriaceae bacterium AU392]